MWDFELRHLTRDTNEYRSAQWNITRHHYLRRWPDPRTSVEVYEINRAWLGGTIGYLVFGRGEATRCGTWYGSVDDVRAGRCEVTRWQVLNLARVWLEPAYQATGVYHQLRMIPGFVDRRGVFRSTLASEILRAAVQVIGYEYLIHRPPCFLDEPYQIEWLLSYCDTRLHRGTIYAAAGFERYRVNRNGIETWRIRLPALTDHQHKVIRSVSMLDPRAIGYRVRRQYTAVRQALPDLDRLMTDFGLPAGEQLDA